MKKILLIGLLTFSSLSATDCQGALNEANRLNVKASSIGYSENAKINYIIAFSGYEFVYKKCKGTYYEKKAFDRMDRIRYILRTNYGIDL